MTSRQKRAQKKKAEEVQYALKGYVKCPECKGFTDLNKMAESFWHPHKKPMCLDCRNRIEVEFIREISKEMDKDAKTGVEERLKAIYKDTRK